VLSIAVAASAQRPAELPAGWRQGATDCRTAGGARADNDGAERPNLPEGPEAADELRFAAIGDAGTGCDPRDANKRLMCELTDTMLRYHAASRFGMLMLLGDNVYESGEAEDFREKLYAPLDELSQRGVLVRGVVGNHDVRSYEAANLQMKFFQSADAAAQRKYFTTPVERHAAYPESATRYYSFIVERAGAEFFMLDSSMLTGDCCGPLGFWRRKYKRHERLAQIEWLVRSLAASQAKWKIVVLHHPLYSSSAEHGVRLKGGRVEMLNEMRALRVDPIEEGPARGKTIEQVLRDGGVRIAITAHDHVYERIVPQHGVHYFVSGGAAKLRREDFDKPVPPFHHCGESRKASFMLFSVRPEGVRFWAVGQDGEVFDGGSVR
jgi:hypothetical protein